MGRCQCWGSRGATCVGWLCRLRRRLTCHRSATGHASTLACHLARTQELTEPLLQAEEEGAAPSPTTPRAGVDDGAAQRAALLTPPQQLMAFGETLWKQRSLPPLAAYSSLEPYDTFLSSGFGAVGGGALLPFLPACLRLASCQVLGAACSSQEVHTPFSKPVVAADQELPSGFEERASLVAAAATAAAEEEARGRAAVRGPSADGQLSAPPAAPPGDGAAVDALLASSVALGGGPAVQPPGSSSQLAAEGMTHLPAGGATREGGASASLQALRLIWAPLAALALSSTIALTLFPFFTYVPSTGTIGELLPKVGVQAQGGCLVRSRKKAAARCQARPLPRGATKRRSHGQPPWLNPLRRGLTLPCLPPTPRPPLILLHRLEGALLHPHLRRRPGPLPAAPLAAGSGASNHAAAGRGRQAGR